MWKSGEKKGKIDNSYCGGQPTHTWRTNTDECTPYQFSYVFVKYIENIYRPSHTYAEKKSLYDEIHLCWTYGKCFIKIRENSTIARVAAMLTFILANIRRWRQTTTQNTYKTVYTFFLFIFSRLYRRETFGRICLLHIVQDFRLSTWKMRNEYECERIGIKKKCKNKTKRTAEMQNGKLCSWVGKHSHVCCSNTRFHKKNPFFYKILAHPHSFLMFKMIFF